MILCKTPFQDDLREYSDPSGMLDDGFTVSDVAYAKALTMWTQEPHPQTFKVGKRKSIPTYKYRLAPQETTEGFVYRFDVKGTEISYTVAASASKAIVATALAAAITAISGVTAAVVDTDKVEVTDGTAGAVHSLDIRKLDPFDVMRYEDVTADPGVVTDLDRIYKIDPNWYGLLLDVGGSATVEAAAAWIAAKKLLFAFDSYDTDIIDVSVSSDLFSVLQSNSYDRTVPLFRRIIPHQTSGNADAAWLAYMLTFDPGAATWAHKALKGVPVDELQAGWMTQIEAKGGNHYTEVAGLGATLYGITSSGEFVDIRRFIDYLENTIGIEVWRIKANNAKVAFTDAGIALLVGAVQTVLGSNTATPEEPNKGLAPEPPPRASAPSVQGIPAADRIARVLDSLGFTANLTGAIHTTKVVGSISV
jgi:hypothetical protein